MRFISRCVLLIGLCLGGLCLGGLCFAANGVAEEEWKYLVQPGDTLSEISERHLISIDAWYEVAEYNNLKTNRLRIGSVLRIPVRLVRLPAEPARLIFVSGEVQLLRAGESKPIAAARDMKVQANDSLKTGQDGFATLLLPGGSTVNLQPVSEIHLSRLERTGRTTINEIEVKAGRVETETKPSGDPRSNFKVRTPAATALVRGTVFRVQAQADVMRTEVTGGQVGVSAQGITRKVAAGRGTLTETGKPPLPPRKLLPAPQFDRFPKPIAAQDEVEWGPLDGAQAYRVQMARDQNFGQIVFTARVESAAVRLPQLPRGDYYIRVRGVDQIGLEGFNAQSDLQLVHRPAAPVGLSSTAHARRPLLKWDSSEGVSHYRVQIARDPQMAQWVVAEERIDATEYQPPAPLPYGVSFWRIAAVSPESFDGPFSKVGSLEVPLPVPTVFPEVRGRQIRLRFQPRPSEDLHYELRLSQDPEFESGGRYYPIADQPFVLVTEPRDLGFWYLRAQAVTPDGLRGKPSQRYEIFVSHP